MDTPHLKFLLHVIEKGKIFKPALLPATIERGQVGDCFDRCLIEAMKHPEYRYVEGIASIPRTAADRDKEKEWLLHAWLTDGVHAFDPTWNSFAGSVEVPIPSIYIGMEMATADVVEFIKSTGYKSVIANSQMNITLAQKALKIKSLK